MNIQLTTIKFPRCLHNKRQKQKRKFRFTEKLKLLTVEEPTGLLTSRDSPEHKLAHNQVLRKPNKDLELIGENEINGKIQNILRNYQY